MYDLTGKYALVTGASRGIGNAAAKALATAGAHTILLATDKGSLQTTKEEIENTGGSASILPFDLSDLNKISDIGDFIKNKSGKLDIFIANAAVMGEETALKDLNPEQWEETININLTANAFLIKTLHPYLEKSDAARVLFVTSGMAYGEYTGGNAYAVSKGALETLAKTYNEETKGTKIRVNMIDPGVIDTDIHTNNDTPHRSAESIAHVFVQHSASETKKRGKRIEAWRYKPF